MTKSILRAVIQTMVAALVWVGCSDSVTGSGGAFTLTINRSPTNGGTVTPASGLRHTAEANTPIDISATSGSGFSFANWTITSGTATFGNANNANTTVTLSSDATIVANFHNAFTDSRDGKTL